MLFSGITSAQVQKDKIGGSGNKTTSTPAKGGVGPEINAASPIFDKDMEMAMTEATSGVSTDPQHRWIKDGGSGHRNHKGFDVFLLGGINNQNPGMQIRVGGAYQDRYFSINGSFVKRSLIIDGKKQLTNHFSLTATIDLMSFGSENPKKKFILNIGGGIGYQLLRFNTPYVNKLGEDKVSRMQGNTLTPEGIVEAWFRVTPHFYLGGSFNYSYVFASQWVNDVEHEYKRHVFAIEFGVRFKFYRNK